LGVGRAVHYEDDIYTCIKFSSKTIPLNDLPVLNKSRVIPSDIRLCPSTIFSIEIVDMIQSQFSVPLFTHVAAFEESEYETELTVSIGRSFKTIDELC
jgi:hypothetical protein